jgi:lysyl-tRNA synthetase class 2
MPSRVIRLFYYDRKARRLDVVFVSGRRYSYHEVPEEVYSRMVGAFSKGEFFNAQIKDRFRCTPEGGGRVQS